MFNFELTISSRFKKKKTDSLSPTGLQDVLTNGLIENTARDAKKKKGNEGRVKGM